MPFEVRDANLMVAPHCEVSQSRYTSLHSSRQRLTSRIRFPVRCELPPFNYLAGCPLYFCEHQMHGTLQEGVPKSRFSKRQALLLFAIPFTNRYIPIIPRSFLVSPLYLQP